MNFQHLLPDRRRSRYRITGLTAGVHHVVALLDVYDTRSPSQITQMVVGWGSSQRNQLGQQKAVPRTSIPVRIPSPSHVKSIAAGSQHTVLLHTSGSITSYGSDRKDQLSSLDSINSASTIGCTWNGTYTLLPTGLTSTGSSSKGQLGRVERSSSSSTPVPSTGFGTIEFERPIDKIACGSEHVLLLSEGEVWAWGWNEHGNLGLGHQEDVYVPTKVPIQGRALNVWAGCGNSWVLVEHDDADG